MCTITVFDSLTAEELCLLSQGVDAQLLLEVLDKNGAQKLERLHDGNWIVIQKYGAVLSFRLVWLHQMTCLTSLGQSIFLSPFRVVFANFRNLTGCTAVGVQLEEQRGKNTDLKGTADPNVLH